MSYLIKWREMQGPNELDGAASTRSDTLPLGVTTDRIISSLPSTLDNSINGLIDWDQGCCHNRFQCSGNNQAAASIFSGIQKWFIAQKQGWNSRETLLFTTSLTTRWQSWTIKKIEKAALSFPAVCVFICLCFISHHKVFTSLHQSVEGGDYFKACGLKSIVLCIDIMPEEKQLRIFFSSLIVEKHLLP